MPGEMQPHPLKVVPDNLTGWDSSLPLQLHTRLNRETCDEIVALKLRQVGLAGCREKFPRELSGAVPESRSRAFRLAEVLARQLLRKTRGAADGSRGGSA